MTIAVDLGRKATKQTNKQNEIKKNQNEMNYYIISKRVPTYGPTTRGYVGFSSLTPMPQCTRCRFFPIAIQDWNKPPPTPSMS